MTHEDVSGGQGETTPPPPPDIQVTGFWQCSDPHCGTLVSFVYKHCGWCMRPRRTELEENEE